MKRNTKIALGAGAALLAVGGTAYVLGSRKSAAPSGGAPAPAPGGGPQAQVAPPGGFITPGTPGRTLPGINRVNVPGGAIQNPNAGTPLAPPPVAVTLDNGQVYAFSLASAIPALGLLTPDQVLASQLQLAGFSAIDVTACFPSDAGGNICSGFATWAGDQGAPTPTIPGVVWMSLAPSIPAVAGQH